MKTKFTLIIILAVIAVGGIWAVFNANRAKYENSFLIKPATEINTANWSEIAKQAIQQENRGNLQEAKYLNMKLVSDFPNSSQVGDWERKVGELNIKLLFSPVVTPGSIIYEIKSGDSLAKIAKKYNTTVDLLKKSNNLSSDVIIAGKKLKVWTKPFNIVVDKSQNILFLKSNDEVVKSYTISTGLNNSTPTGNFKIVNKLISPTWFRAGAIVPPESPDNILGSRWMGFDLEGYGIHGTTDEGSLGQQITQGCVRMSNFDVEELFTIVPINTVVTIVD